MWQSASDKEKLYAHTPNKNGEWDLLVDHLYKVAQKAREFADFFAQGDLAYFIGLSHDLGKANSKFQRYLLAQHEGEYFENTPHAWAGAAVFYQYSKGLPWKELCIPVNGHHAGLGEVGLFTNRLVSKMTNNVAFVEELRQMLVQLITQSKCGVPSRITCRNSGPFQQELMIRMLFSALIDADRLATEEHFQHERIIVRSKWPKIEELWERFLTDQEKILAGADQSRLINKVRNEVYNYCLEASKLKPGFFSLTVPTGGGKTRSSLAFALKHCLQHQLRRIIIVIPYTSIIDQTAQTCRDILGSAAVLEHHSQIDYDAIGDKTNSARTSTELITQQELATENWDAPLIVTTTVQLFESLFHNNPSKCRKLHNLAGSTIILDEVQTLPTKLLAPTMDVLRILTEDYNVTVVLCTATQPALESTPFLQELEGVEVREIVHNFKRHFQVLKRVNYELRSNPITMESIVRELEVQKQVLAVFNTRKDALSAISMLAEREDALHLSTLLCPAHRKKVLKEVRRRLDRRQPICLISTQVIEAGVDVDFPVVYRVLGPLDRIVQVAGRCNREGKLKAGKVVVFELEDGRAPKGEYASGTEKTRLLLRVHPDRLHDPDFYQEYYKRLYHDLDLDFHNIQQYREVLNYPKVAELYKLIPDNTCSVVVPYEEAFDRLDEWLRYPSRDTWRRLQPYLVALYEDELRTFEKEGWVDKPAEGLYRWNGGYDQRRGVVAAYYDPADLTK